ncbi:hypothetical protein Tco_1474246 [Tanacetum coccineum]
MSGFGSLDVYINVVRKVQRYLSTFSVSIGNKLGTVRVPQLSIPDFLDFTCGQYLSIIILLSTSKVMAYALDLRLALHEISVKTRTRSLHVPSVIPVRTVASIPIGGVSQESLVDHCLDGFGGHVVWVGVVDWRVWSSSGCSANNSVRHVANLSLLSSDDSESFYHLSPWRLRSVSRTIAVSGVPVDRSHVHTHDHDGSEAPDELPDSIPSNEPKPLGKHRPPPPPSIRSPGDSASFTTLVLTIHGHKVLSLELPLPDLPKSSSGTLLPSLSGSIWWTKATSLRGGCADSRISSLRVKGDGLCIDGDDGGKVVNEQVESCTSQGAPTAEGR